MNITQRLEAAATYVPLLGWLYVLLARPNSPFAMFHLRQSLGLFLGLCTVMGGWAAATWALAWVPFGFMFGIALFALVIAAAICGAVGWVIGIVGALRGQVAFLPVFGRTAERLPLRVRTSTPPRQC